MKTKSKKDIVLGAFSICIAAIVTYMSMQLKATGYDGDPGPRMFPMIGGFLMAICGIALIIAPGKSSGAFMTGAQWKAAGALFGVYVLFAVLFYLVGFTVAVPIMLFVVTFMLSKLSAKNTSVKKRLIISAIFGVVGGAALYLAYIVGLGAAMPKGILWSLFK